MNRRDSCDASTIALDKGPDASGFKVERQLVAQARSGDAHAFGVLIRTHDDKMRGLAYRLLGDRALMDDALQDAYCKAFRSVRQFDPEQSGARFATWLYRVVHSVCIDHHRAVARRPQRTMRAIEDVAVTAPDPAAGIAQRQDLRLALSRLSPDHAAVIALVDGEGYSYDEVAETLGIKPGTVGSRLNRAHAALRAELHEKGSDR